ESRHGGGNAMAVGVGLHDRPDPGSRGQFAYARQVVPQCGNRDRGGDRSAHDVRGLLAAWYNAAARSTVIRKSGYPLGHGETHIPMKRGFYTIMAAQFFSSLADNALLIAAIAMLIEMTAPE